jgi:hypothetical protein
MCHEKQAPRQISSLEPKAHDITRRVDVVPPKQLKAELNLGEIGMRIGIWPGRLYSAVPDAICFNPIKQEWPRFEPSSQTNLVVQALLLFSRRQNGKC